MRQAVDAGDARPTPLMLPALFAPASLQPAVAPRTAPPSRPTAAKMASVGASPRTPSSASSSGSRGGAEEAKFQASLRRTASEGLGRQPGASPQLKRGICRSMLDDFARVTVQAASAEASQTARGAAKAARGAAESALTAQRLLTRWEWETARRLVHEGDVIGLARHLAMTELHMEQGQKRNALLAAVIAGRQDGAGPSAAELRAERRHLARDSVEGKGTGALEVGVRELFLDGELSWPRVRLLVRGDAVLVRGEGALAVAAAAAAAAAGVGAPGGPKPAADSDDGGAASANAAVRKASAPRSKWAVAGVDDKAVNGSAPLRKASLSRAPASSAVSSATASAGIC
eukprot:TRINITY_DN2786_c0_g2_i1.p2 TRINITY_DN2786_c0_g2~~TRINITY_DN2786_c0_g2_i1.p2  ORF type:complete len:345 (-),score=89.53 TRINITY_DN2786_c0_g2_i1:101-1135(-)